MTAVALVTLTEVQWSVAEGDVHGSRVSNVLHQKSYEEEVFIDSNVKILNIEKSNYFSLLDCFLTSIWIWALFLDICTNFMFEMVLFYLQIILFI